MDINRETLDPCYSDKYCIHQTGIASSVRQSHLFGVDDISFHDSQFLIMIDEMLFLFSCFALRS